MPYAAPSRCTEPGCRQLAVSRGRCDDHPRQAWANRAPAHERYGQSGSARQKLHDQVKADAGYICYVCGLPGADTVDHIIAITDGGSRTARSNLGAIHQEPCHEEKTKAENARRRARRAEKRAAAAAAG